MQFQFEIVPDDMKAFAVYHYRHSPSQKRWARWTLFGSAVASTAVVFLIAWIADDLFSPFFFILWAVVMIGLVVLFPSMMERSVVGQVDQTFKEGTNKGILGHHRIALDERGVACESEFTESKIGWGAIERVGVDADHVYLYNTSASALIVPRRAFEDDATYDAFVEEVARYRGDTAASA